MKCGREVGEDQVFCSICLADMEKHPVKPGTAVQLPSRKDSPVVKKPAVKRRQMPSPEERIKKLKKRIKRLALLWLITLLLLAATAYPTVRFVQDYFSLRPGQNYTTITDISATLP
jgi:predicted nucleic acid-binding Zn ribbon protein